MLRLLLVGAGGFIGSILRYALGGLTQRLFPAAALPVGTLAVNVLGCLAIGYCGALAETRGLIGDPLRVFLFVGVFGGFTTYSSFGYDTMALLRSGEGGQALVYVGAHLLLGIGAVWAGYALARGWH